MKRTVTIEISGAEHSLKRFAKTVKEANRIGLLRALRAE
jgi:hypothetical protein